MTVADALAIAIGAILALLAIRYARRSPTGRCINCGARAPGNQLQCTDCWEADAW